MIRYAVVLFIVGFSVLPATGQERLTNGTIAPNFKTIDHHGRKIELDSLLDIGPVVITFYRGEWCPHCNNYMRNLQDSIMFIDEYNASILAITPESDMYIDETIHKTGASFSIIWDKDHKIMDKYKVAFRLSDGKNAIYKVGGINVKKASGSDHRMLPVPATYIISQDGNIKGGFFNEDYSLRMPVHEILSILNKK